MTKINLRLDLRLDQGFEWKRIGNFVARRVVVVENVHMVHISAIPYKHSTSRLLPPSSSPSLSWFTLSSPPQKVCHTDIPHSPTLTHRIHRQPGPQILSPHRLSWPHTSQSRRQYVYLYCFFLNPPPPSKSINFPLVVRTKLDDDLKPLQAKSITISVRCYEARLGRVTVLHSNILVDHTQTLWTKPDDAEYAPVGELEFPFKIVLPTKVAGFSTSVFVDYRCSWRVEAG